MISKTKVNVVKEVEVEMELPYFCKSENEHKALNADGHTIIVKTYRFATSIEFSETLNEGLVFEEGYIEIEESEFNEAFKDAVEFLASKILKPIKL